jgi:hypothetical protein
MPILYLLCWTSGMNAQFVSDIGQPGRNERNAMNCASWRADSDNPIAYFTCKGLLYGL